MRGADAGEETTVSDGEAFAGEVCGEVRVVEIEVDAVRVLDASGFELDLASEIYGDAGVGGGGPVADAGDRRVRWQRGGDWLEVCGLGIRSYAADAGEHRSEDDAAERDFPAGAHAEDSLGLRELWSEANPVAGAELCTCKSGAGGLFFAEKLLH